MWRRRLVWLGLCVLSLAAITYYGGVISYSFLYACIILPVISAVYLFYVYCRFTIYQEIESRDIVCGQPMPYSFTLQNEDITVYTGIGVRLFTGFSSVEDMEDNKQYLLFPGSSRQFHTRLLCKYRGEYDIGVKEILLYDFFGIFRICYKIPSTIRALVSPRIVKLVQLKSLPQLSNLLEMENAHSEVENDVLTREYIAGDPLKKVNWKLTARSGELRVRKEIGIRRQNITLILDMERVSVHREIYLPLENKILEVGIALLYYFAAQNTGVQLIWESISFEKKDVMNLRHFELVFPELSAVMFQEGKKVQITLEKAISSRQLAESSLIFLVVHELNRDLFAILEKLSREEKIVVVYVITQEDITEYVRQNNLRLYITAIGPEQEPDEVL